MIRGIIVTLSAFLVQIFFAALFLNLGSSTTVFIVPAAIILVTNEFHPHEALFSLLLLGLLIDAWIGAPLGTVMLVMGFLFSLAYLSIAWLGKPDIWIRTAFIFLFALAFRVCVALALGMAGGTKGNWEWIQIFAMPLIDTVIGTFFYDMIMKVLPILGLCEVKENTSQRLSRRSPRISLK